MERGDMNGLELRLAQQECNHHVHDARLGKGVMRGVEGEIG